MPPPSSADLASLAAHQVRVRTLVHALLRDEHAADDVVQEAWVRTIESGPRDPGALRLWFERVARRIALNRLRGERRRGWRERETARDEALPSSADIAAGVELHKRLLDALQALPEPQRSAVRDRYFGELTPTEIARRDGVSVDTVKSRLARGRALLRERLDEGTGQGRGAWSTAFLPLALPIREMSAQLAASAATAASASTSATTTVVLGTLAMKKLLVAAAVVAASILTWKAWPNPEVAPRATPSQEVERSTKDDQLIARRTTTAAPNSEPSGAPLADPSPRTRTSAAERSWTVSGLVRWSRTADATLDQPVDVTVSLFDGPTAEGEPREEQTLRSEPNGTFRWTPATQSGLVTLRAQVDDGELFAIPAEPITVEAGEDEAALTVTLVRRDAAIVGVVLEPDGTVAGGATVLAGGFETRADEDGAYRLAVPRGLGGLVMARADGCGQVVREVEGAESGEEVRCDFRLVPELRIAGVVRDEAGRPVEGAVVRTFHGREIRATSDASGRYELRHLSRTTRSSVMIFARRDGLCEAREDRRIPDSGALEVDFVMKRGARVAGRVVGPQGEALDDVGLFIGFSPNAYDRIDATSDGDGAFVFPVVPSGNQKLWARHAGFAPFVTEIEVVEGSSSAADVLVQMEVGRTLTGVVRDASGAPLERVSLAARKDGESVGARAMTGSDGRFELRDLPSGSLRLIAFGDLLMREEVEIAANHSGDVEIAIGPSGIVRGRVVDGSTGSPIQSFTVRFADPILDAGDERIRRYTARWVREGRTFSDPDGAWDTGDEELEIGAVTGIQVSATGYASALHPRAVVASRDADGEVVIELWKPVTLHVDVVGGEGRTPLVGVTVRATQEKRRGEHDLAWESETDTSGSAKLTNVPPGPLFLTAIVASGAEHSFGPFEIDHEESVQRIEIAVRASGSISGVTRDDATGEATGGVRLSLVPIDVEGVEGGRSQATSDASGGYSFVDLAPGVYQVQRLGPEGAGDRSNLSLRVRVGASGTDGMHAQRDVQRPSGSATVSGHLSCDAKLPDGIEVSLVRSGDEGFSLTAWTANDRFEFTEVPAGRYTLSATHFDRSTAVQFVSGATVGATAGQPVTASLEMLRLE